MAAMRPRGSTKFSKPEHLPFSCEPVGGGSGDRRRTGRVASRSLEPAWKGSEAHRASHPRGQRTGGHGAGGKVGTGRVETRTREDGYGGAAWGISMCGGGMGHPKPRHSECSSRTNKQRCTNKLPSDFRVSRVDLFPGGILVF